MQQRAQLLELGKVLHRSRNGYIVVEMARQEKLPPLGTPVYTGDRRRVGVLLDIIGPVKQPYAVVKPDSQDISLEPGSLLYFRPPRPKAPRRRGGRRAEAGRRAPPRQQRGAKQGRGGGKGRRRGAGAGSQRRGGKRP